MKILLYSPVFTPSIGGVETITDTLARNLLELGCECIVVTETPAGGMNDAETFPYRVVRHPSFSARVRLSKECDLVHSNSASVAMVPASLLARRPFIWNHNGYQVSCVDGLGWVDGEAAPIAPIASLKYHCRRRGWLKLPSMAFKLYVRRFVSRWVVRANYAATGWVAMRQPLPKQEVAYTPYSQARFRGLKNSADKWKYDFLYVGRLVSEKGVVQLLEAFRLLADESPKARLLVVGDGDLRAQLEAKSVEWGMDQQVDFVGAKRGEDLVEMIESAEIAVVPSEWEEPMGGVSLEMLTAGKCLIVSSDGGHAEVVGDAGLTFKNGDSQGLYLQMKRLLSDADLRDELRANATARVDLFNERKLSENYLRIYRKHTA